MTGFRRRPGFYPTLSLTNPTFATKLTYNYNLLAPATYTDINGNQTSFADSFDRVTLVTRPDSGKTTYSYNDAPNSVAVLSATDEASVGDQLLTGQTQYDGLGRKTLTETAGVCVSIGYDGLDRVISVSNPSTTCPASSLFIGPSGPSGPRRPKRSAQEVRPKRSA